jgi:hypothetical protein
LPLIFRGSPRAPTALCGLRTTNFGLRHSRLRRDFYLRCPWKRGNYTNIWAGIISWATLCRAMVYKLWIKFEILPTSNRNKPSFTHFNKIDSSQIRSNLIFKIFYQ